MLIKKLVVGPIAANCYIVGSESTKEGMIVDPGADAREILQGVKELGLKIKLIVLTHSHPDHVGAVKEVQKATGAEVAIHIDEASSLSQDSSLFIGANAQASSPPDRLLKDGDGIDIGDLHFSVIHTPGHSPGGICLLGHGVMFSGDTLFNSSIGRYDFSGGSYSQIMSSLHRLTALPVETIVYPGHGDDTTIGNERQGNPFLQ